jgi:hypothetical protein
MTWHAFDHIKTYCSIDLRAQDMFLTLAVILPLTPKIAKAADRTAGSSPTNVSSITQRSWSCLNGKQEIVITNGKLARKTAADLL